MLLTIDSNIVFIPFPVLAEASIISFSSHPIKSIIWSFTTSGSAEGKSTLLIIGMIVKSFSRAKYKLEIVCAWIP